MEKSRPLTPCQPARRQRLNRLFAKQRPEYHILAQGEQLPDPVRPDQQRVGLCRQCRRRDPGLIGEQPGSEQMIGVADQNHLAVRFPLLLEQSQGAGNILSGTAGLLFL